MFIPAEILHLWEALGIFPLESHDFCLHLKAKYRSATSRGGRMCALLVSVLGGGLGAFFQNSFIPRIRAVTGAQPLVPLVSATYALSPYLVEQQQPEGTGKHV